jgi:hypothetical protein
MNYRIASLLASEAANTAGTRTIDVNVKQPISRITIEMKGTNSTSVPVAHPAKMVSKIELVDGSNVLFSLSGVEAQALNFYERGRLPDGLMNYVTGVQCAATFELNFGRWLWDELLAFDPTKFNNPQLKITHNLAAGGSTPTAATLSVFAHCFDEKKATPVGFLMSKEQFSYTLVASAKEAIDLAADIPYRFLLVKSLTAGKNPHENYNKIKLSEDNDARVLINDESVSSLIKLLQEYPRIVEGILTYDLDGEETIYCSPSYLECNVGQGMNAADTALFADQGYGGAFDATGTANQLAQWLITGHMPHGTLLLPFGKKEVIEDFYDVAKVGSLKLTITAGSGASGTVEIFSQQLKKYGA